MSVTHDLKSLILTRTWHVPIAKEQLFDAITYELYKLFPPIIYNSLWFFQPAWDCSNSGNYMDFSLKPEYFYIRHKTDSSTQLREYEKLRAEFERNHDAIIKTAPSFIDNDHPFKLHIDVLRTDESGCDMEIECHPFLYFNITLLKAKVDNLEKQHALLSFERHVKTLAVGLNAKEFDKTESNIAPFSSFLGINQNWMTSTYALQLQEVSITLVAKKKNIALDKKNVERILNKEIKEKDVFFSYLYEAFAIEVKRLYNIQIPLMAMWLRKMRQAVLHEGHNPTEEEKDQAISATVCLLKELKKVYEAETVTANDSAATDKK